MAMHLIILRWTHLNICMIPSPNAVKNGTLGQLIVIPLTVLHQHYFGALGAQISVFKNVSHGIIHTRHEVNVALPGKNTFVF